MKTAALLTCLALPLVALPLAAQTPPQILGAEMLPGWQTPDGTQMAALHLRLAPGWKTYWRSPGDAGLPPQFDWTGSDNLAAAVMHWPVPQVFDLQGMRTIGYDRELVLPIELHPTDPARPMHVTARIDLGICHDICMPAVLDLSLDLATRPPVAPQRDPRIAAALADMPQQGEGGADCEVEQIADGLRVTARIVWPDGNRAEAVVMEPAEPGVWVSDPMLATEGDVLVALADLVPGASKPFDFDKGAMRLTVIGGGHAVELTGCN